MLQATLDKIRDIEEDKFSHPGGKDPIQAKVDEYGVKILEAQTKHHELELTLKAIEKQEAHN